MLALFGYWNDSPPLHEAFARFIGIKPTARPRPATPDATDDTGIDQLMTVLLGAGGFTVQPGTMDSGHA